MATTVERQVEAGSEQDVLSRRSPWRWAVGIVAAVALAAVTASAVAVLWPSPKVRAPEGIASQSSAALYTPQEQKVMSLAAAGVVPGETLDGGIYLIKRLVNEGLIPRQTLDPYEPPVEPLYTDREQLVMQLAAAGLIPGETLNGDPYRTKRLINAGLIPRAAADPVPSPGR